MRRAALVPAAGQAPPSRLRSTDATPTEAEVGADQHGLGGQCVHQNETGELVSCQRREIFVEAQHQHGVHAGIGKQTYFLVHPNEVLGALVGGQQRQKGEGRLFQRLNARPPSRVETRGLKG